MKAAVLEENGIVCKNVPDPIVKDGYVLIKVAYCGICGSDYPRVLEKKAHHYPIILGHEFSGTVEDVGQNVRAVKKGDRVVGVPLIPCFDCDACNTGNYALCSNYSFIGSRVDGAYAEYVCVPDNNVYKVPDDMDLRVAALVEPCTVARHAFSLVDVKNKKVAVIGSGVIGLFAIQWAKIMGANEVTLITHGEKNWKAEDYNCDSIVSNERFCDVVADVVIDCAGTCDSIHSVFKASNKKSTIVLVGTPKTELSFSIRDWEQINRKELKIIGSWMSYSYPFPGVEWEESITGLTNGNLQCLSGMIRCTMDLSSVPHFFNDMKKGNGRAIIRL